MKIICAGLNYVDHINEFKNEVPKEPVFFMKPDTALLQKNKPLYYPEFTKDLQYETELLVKICKPGKYIQEKFAPTYYEEISVGIDFTARDLQKNAMRARMPWEYCKAFDQSAAIGKWVNKAQFKDLNDLHFHLEINGEERQKGHSKDMLFSIDQFIAYVSQFVTLRIGDIIFSGTPSGVGNVEIGDKLTAFLEGACLLDFEIR